MHLTRSSSTPAARASIANLTTSESDTGSDISVPVTLAKPSAHDVTLHFAVIENRNTAWPGIAEVGDTSTADVRSADGSVTIPSGAVTGSVTVHVFGDDVAEADEHFSVYLSTSGADEIVDAFGVITLVDDDGPDSRSPMTVDTLEVREGDDTTRTLTLAVRFDAPAPANSLLSARVRRSDDGVVDSTVTVEEGSTSASVEVVVRPNVTPDDAVDYDVLVVVDTVQAVGRVTVLDDDTRVLRPGRRDGPPRIALVGDSITSDYEFAAKTQLERAGFSVFLAGDAGSGLLDQHECDAGRAEQLVQVADPDVFLLQYIGNYGFRTPCTSGLDTDQNAFRAAWSRALHRNVDALVANDARGVLLTSPLPSNANVRPRAETTNAMVRDLAGSRGADVSLLDVAIDFDGNDPTLRMLDGVHLSERGAARVASAVADTVVRMIDESAR